MTQSAQTAAVATRQQKPIELLKSNLNAPSVQAQFKNALGDNKDMFVASLIDLFTSDANLQRCNPNSLIAEALRAATLKLPLNKSLGFAYIVPYKGQPTFTMGYKGYIQLAMRTGQYKTINADVVFEGELKNVDKLSGSIDFSGAKSSDKVVGYFAHFELLNGFTKTLYMTVEEMAAYAKKNSPSIGKDTTIEDLIKRANSPMNSKSLGWSDFNAMAIKTVIRRLLGKYGYLSVEMQGMVAKENEMEQMQMRDNLTANAVSQSVAIENVEFETVEEEAAQEQPQPQEEAAKEEQPAPEQEPGY